MMATGRRLRRRDSLARRIDERVSRSHQAPVCFANGSLQCPSGENSIAVLTGTHGSSGASQLPVMLSSSTSPTPRLGGRLSHIELGEFLRSGNGPEQQVL